MCFKAIFNMPDHNNKQAKGGSIGSTLACDPRDLSSSPARANLYKHIFLSISFIVTLGTMSGTRFVVSPWPFYTHSTSILVQT